MPGAFTDTSRIFNMKGTWQGQESICRPVMLKSNLFTFTHWPADRLLALPGPFHVIQALIFDTLLQNFFLYPFVYTTFNLALIFATLPQNFYL